MGWRSVGRMLLRLYPDGRKMIAFGACSAVLPEKNRLPLGEAMGWEVENVARFYASG